MQQIPHQDVEIKSNSERRAGRGELGVNTVKIPFAAASVVIGLLP